MGHITRGGVPFAVLAFLSTGLAAQSTGTVTIRPDPIANQAGVRTVKVDATALSSGKVIVTKPDGSTKDVAAGTSESFPLAVGETITVTAENGSTKVIKAVDKATLDITGSGTGPLEVPPLGS